MAQPGTLSRVVLAVLWLLVGVAMAWTALRLAWTRWPTLLTGHPLLLVLTLSCAVLGLIAIGWALASLVIGGRQDRELTSGDVAFRSDAQLRRRAWRRLLLAVPALLGCGLLLGVVAVARPIPAAANSVAALRTTTDVRYADRITWYELAAIRRNADGRTVRPTIGLVFFPGERVDPRAYAVIMRAVARAGYLVVVVKPPLGRPTAALGQASRVMEVHPEIRQWAVGGHSRGGTAAAKFAESHSEVRGLLLYASYPETAVTRPLIVTSIHGGADAVVTPTEIQAARPLLPRKTRYVLVRGAVHSSFGDYGEHPGDGQPTVPRPAAQAQIVQASAQLLASLRPPPPRRR